MKQVLCNTPGGNPASVSIEVSGTWTGTVAFEATLDGATWVDLAVVNLATLEAATSTDSNGSFACGARYREVRANTSGVLTGEAEVTIGYSSIPSPTGSLVTSIADTASEGLVLAANPNRRGFSATNDSSAACYLLCAPGTASATNYTVKLAQGDYFEDPVAYPGEVRAVWATDPGDGGLRVTEYI